MAIHWQNRACQPFMFCPWSVSKYADTYLEIAYSGPWASVFELALVPHGLQRNIYKSHCIR